MSSCDAKPVQAVPSPMIRWLREPLLHFLLIGAALFAIYYVRNPESFVPDGGNRIEITSDDLRQLEAGWMSQYQRPPTPQEMQRMVDARIREEVLYREALALGLDQNDTVVRRRMAQKMEFLAEDLADLPEPSRAELEVWYRANSDRFSLPPHITFRHVYFSPQKRGANAKADAEAALKQIAAQLWEASESSTQGDVFMYENLYSDRLPDDVSSLFGVKFSDALFNTPLRTWSGPIESGMGWHVVFVESLTPGRVPDMSEVESDVLNEWVADQRAEFKRMSFEGMKARYEIIVPATLMADGAGGAAATATHSP